MDIIDNKANVDIWHINYAPELIRTNILSPEEIRRGDEFKFAKHKNMFLAYRSAMREILSRYAYTAPEKLSFEQNKYGKPIFVGKYKDIKFNLSHSHKQAILGVTMDCDLIGVDIEKHDSILHFDSIIKKFIVNKIFKTMFY